MSVVRLIVGGFLVVLGLILTTPTPSKEPTPSEESKDEKRTTFSVYGNCCCDGGPEHHHPLGTTCVEHRKEQMKYRERQ